MASVAALTTATGLLRLRAALEPEFVVYPAAGPEHLLALERTIHPDVFFIGVDEMGAPALHILPMLVTRLGVQRILVYAPLTRRLARGLVQVTLPEFPFIILEDVEDSTRLIQERTEDIAAADCSRALVQRLPLGDAEPLLRASIGELARSPRRFRSVHDLARAAHLSVRTLYRRCDELGLASPRLLVAGFRLLRACWLVRELGLSLSAAARRIGSPSTLALSRQLRRLLDVNAHVIARSDPAEIIDALGTLLSSPTRNQRDTGIVRIRGSAFRYRGARRATRPSVLSP